jgi:hypothetical protein
LPAFAKIMTKRWVVKIEQRSVPCSFGRWNSGKGSMSRKKNWPNLELGFYWKKSGRGDWKTNAKQGVSRKKNWPNTPYTVNLTGCFK